MKIILTIILLFFIFQSKQAISNINKSSNRVPIEQYADDLEVLEEEQVDAQESPQPQPSQLSEEELYQFLYCNETLEQLDTAWDTAPQPNTHNMDQFEYDFAMSSDDGISDLFDIEDFTKQTSENIPDEWKEKLLTENDNPMVICQGLHCSPASNTRNSIKNRKFFERTTSASIDSSINAPQCLQVLCSICYDTVRNTKSSII